MQIRPITPVSYTNQGVQNNKQQSFGMATTARMKKAISTNMAEILNIAAKGETKVIEQLRFIEKHPLAVGWTGDGDALVIIANKAKSKGRTVETTLDDTFSTLIDKTVQYLQQHDELAANVSKAGEKIKSLEKQFDKISDKRTKFAEATTKRILAGNLNDPKALAEANDAMTTLESTVEQANMQHSAADRAENDAHAKLVQFFTRDKLPQDY